MDTLSQMSQILLLIGFGGFGYTAASSHLLNQPLHLQQGRATSPPENGFNDSVTELSFSHSWWGCAKDVYH
jgi:hypothetical protein